MTDLEQELDRQKREREDARSELSRLRPFVEVVRSFLRSGYDGEFIGPEVEPLFKAMAELDRAEDRDEALSRVAVGGQISSDQGMVERKRVTGITPDSVK